MTIIFLGNFEVSYSSENHHKKSLELLGHNVISLQENKVNADVVIEFARNADLFVWVHTHGWKVFDGIAYKADELIPVIKSFGVTVISYHLDLWFGIERQKDLDDDPFYKQLDWFFATDKLMCDWFNENTSVKGYYLPAGVFSEEVILFDEPKNKDVVFVGSKGYHPEWNYRPKLIDWLRNSYGSYFTHIGGDGDTGTVRGLELNKMYAQSKIAVGDTLCLGFDYPYYFSDRLFESTGRGAFTIFPYIKGIEHYFEIDKEIVVYNFNDFDMLRQKIDYYLEYEDEREAIRKAGFERTKKDHTYLNRWAEIIKVIEGATND